jgi:hypothetical protein
MFKARIAAEKDLEQAYLDTGLTEAEVRAFLETNPKFASPLHHSPHFGASSAGNLVREVAPLIKLSATQRAVLQAKETLATTKAVLASGPKKARELYAFAASPDTHARLREDYALLRDLAAGKAKERFGPIVERLAKKAYFENNPEVQPHIREEVIAAE